MQDIFDRLTATHPDDAPAQIPEQPTEPNPIPAPEETPAPGYTPRQIKECCQELLKCGLLEMERKPKLYQTALTHHRAIDGLLEPLDLALRIDDIRGLAFVVVSDPLLDTEADDTWTHPLVRRQRLNLEQSLLIAILRRQFLRYEQEIGIGAAGIPVQLDELIPELQIFLGDLGSDSREQTRLRNLLEKLKGHGIVSEIDANEQITIRPIIAHVANPDNLQALLETYRRLAAAQGETS